MSVVKLYSGAISAIAIFGGAWAVTDCASAFAARSEDPTNNWVATINGEIPDVQCRWVTYDNSKSPPGDIKLPVPRRWENVHDKDRHDWFKSSDIYYKDNDAKASADLIGSDPQAFKLKGHNNSQNFSFVITEFFDSDVLSPSDGKTKIGTQKIGYGVSGRLKISNKGGGIASFIKFFTGEAKADASMTGNDTIFALHSFGISNAGTPEITEAITRFEKNHDLSELTDTLYIALGNVPDHQRNPMVIAIAAEPNSAYTVTDVRNALKAESCEPYRNRW